MTPFLKTFAAAGAVAVSIATATFAFDRPDQTDWLTFMDVYQADDKYEAMEHAALVKPLAEKYGVELTQVYDVRNVDAGMHPGEWIYMFRAPDPRSIAELLNDPDYVASTGPQDTIHSIVPAQHFLLTPMVAGTH